MTRLAPGQWLRAAIVALWALPVLACPVRAGVLDATWNAPTTNAGGESVTGLASYRVYYGTSDPPCPTSSFLAVPSITSAPEPGAVVSFTLTGLITGAVYFVQVTALDASGNESACSNLASGVARPDPADATPPTVIITSPATSPTYSTGSNTLTLTGTASDNEGVAQVSWTNSQGGSGTATGTTNWTASGIVLLPGTNVLTVTATDAAGNAGAATLTVNYVLAPTITSISPTNVIAGGSAFTLVVAGMNFVDSSEVQVNGAPRTTSYVSPTQLAATVLANDIAEPGTVQVTVVTPPPSGGTSNPASLTINPTSATATTTTSGSTTTESTTTSIGGSPPTGSTSTGGSTPTTTGGSTTSSPTTGSSTTTSPGTSATTASTATSSTAWAAGQSYVDPSSSMTVVRVTDAATAPGGATGNSSASDSMFNADGTLFYLHHGNVGTFLYSADRGTGQVTQLGQLPATTPNGDPLAYDGAPWDPTKPNVLYAIVISTARRELWQLTLPLPAAMTLLHDFSNEVPTGGSPSSRVQVSPDGRYFVIAASTTGGPGTYDHIAVWDRQTGGGQALQLPAGIGGLMLRSMVFDSSGASGLLETIDSSGRTDVVFLLVPSAPPSTATTPPSVSFSAPTSGATVAGTLTVTASMADNVGITRVQYYLDGALVAVYSPPVGRFTWDSATVGDGSHTWKAVVYGAAGNTAQAAVTFTVSNAPK